MSYCGLVDRQQCSLKNIKQTILINHVYQIPTEIIKYQSFIYIPPRKNAWPQTRVELVTSRKFQMENNPDALPLSYSGFAARKYFLIAYPLLLSTKQNICFIPYAIRYIASVLYATYNINQNLLFRKQV